MHLTVKLREGFNNDSVTIRLNGKEVYRKSGISTDLTISFADTVNIDVAAASITLQVSVASGLTQTVNVHVAQTPFIEVWIIDGKMELRKAKSETPML